MILPFVLGDYSSGGDLSASDLREVYDVVLMATRDFGPWVLPVLAVIAFGVWGEGWMRGIATIVAAFRGRSK